jgi:threonine/homoserine/homoserine lactone efflux protein
MGDNAVVNLGSVVLPFALVAGLVTITPGLDTALVLRATLRHGRANAYATAVGIGIGCLVWGVGAAVGISALLTTSTAAYTVVRVVGAAYMIWLGVGMLRAAWRRPRAHGSGPTAEPSAAEPSAAEPSAVETTAAGAAQAGGGAARAEPPGSNWAAFRSGLLTNLLNPKVGAFYIAMLPQFIPAGASQVGTGALLAGVHVAEGLVWFTVLILAATAARAWLARPTTQRAVDAVAGTAVVGFALKLGLTPRT